MEGHATGAPTQAPGAGSGRLVAVLQPRHDDSPPDIPWFRRDGLLVFVLLAVGVGCRAWLMQHTEVAARDSIGYIRQAWQLSHEPLLPTLRHAQQHPGYPAVILLTSHIVRPFRTEPEPLLMQFSAQLASSIAGALLVIPMFFLGKVLFHRGIGFSAALLFQVLPSSARVLSDGLSEGVFLLLACSGLLFATLALKRHAPGWFVLTGIASGLAYLTRPEGAFIVAATGVVLVAQQFRPAWRTSWLRSLACGASMGLSALAIGGPLVLATGEITVKATPKDIVKGLLSEAAPLPSAPRLAMAHRASTGVPLVIGDWWQEQHGSREVWAIKALGLELARGSFYMVGLLILLGVWRNSGQFLKHPGLWVLLLVSLAILICLWRVAARMGYLSDRHTLLVLLCGIIWAPFPLFEFGPTLGRGVRFLAWPWAKHLPLPVSPVWPTFCLGVLVAVMLPKTLEPLHANRAGFRHAGLWLAKHANPWDPVLDPYCWSHYYAGKVFQEGLPNEPPAGVVPQRYVVVDLSGNEHSRLPLMKEALALTTQGTAVFRWTGRRERDDWNPFRSATKRDRTEIIDVVVYAVPPAR